MKIIIWTLIILFFGAPVWAEQPPKEWVRQEIRKAALRYQVNPALPQAVAEMESGRDLKCGQLNKAKKWEKTLHGPMGVRGSFLKTGDILEVIDVGVRSFRGLSTESTIIHRLKIYNPQWWKDNYLRCVMARYRQIKRGER